MKGGVILNTTICVALITAIATTVPSIIIAIINNHNQLKLKKYEEDEVAKRQSIIEFIEATTKCSTNHDGTLYSGEIINFQKAVNTLLLYFPKTDLKTIDKLYELISDKNIRAKDEELRPLIIKLSKELFEN